MTLDHITLLQLVGSVFIASMGAVCIYTALSITWAGFTREALFIMGLAQFVFVASRMLFILGVTTSGATIVIGGMIGATTTATLIVLALFHHAEHRVTDKINELQGLTAKMAARESP